MPDGDLLVATQDPFLAVVRDDGSTGWERYPRMPDFRAQYDTLGVASNWVWYFDLVFEHTRERHLYALISKPQQLTLSGAVGADGETTRPRQ